MNWRLFKDLLLWFLWVADIVYLPDVPVVSVKQYCMHHWGFKWVLYVFHEDKQTDWWDFSHLKQSLYVVRLLNLHIYINTILAGLDDSSVS